MFPILAKKMAFENRVSLSANFFGRRTLCVVVYFFFKPRDRKAESTRDIEKVSV